MSNMASSSTLPWPVFMEYAGVIVAAFFVLWAILTYVLSFISGWRTLAFFYESKQPFGGRLGPCTGCFMGMMPCQMGPFFAMGTSAEGLYLVMRHDEWAGYRPLLIPWSDITLEASRITFWPTDALSFTRVPGTKLWLPSGMRPVLEQYLASSHP